MLSKINTNISDYFKKKNVKRFSIFFLIAFVFLLFSKLSNDYKQTIKLQVSLTNLDDEIILQNDSLNIINAYVEAKGFSLVPFVFKKTKTIVFNSETDVLIQSNHYILDVQKHKFVIEDQLGKSYKILSIKPDTLLLAYAKLASKVVPIVLNHKISYAPGFDISKDFSFDVDSVKIVGSSTVVNSIDFLNTELLELTDVNKDIVETLEFDTSNYTDIEIFPNSVKVSNNVIRFTEGTIEVPVVIINKPSGVDINYFPKTVALSYYVDLERYSSIVPSDFILECDYAQLKANQTYLVPKITRQPDFVKRVSIKQNQIDFIKL